MGSIVAAKACLLLVILCSSFLDVFSQDCTVVPIFEQIVSEKQTTILGTVVIGGIGTPTGLILYGDCETSSNYPTCFVSAKIIGREIRFSPGTTFNNYLAGTSLPRVDYSFTCTDAAGVDRTVSGAALFTIRSESNRAPEFNLRTTTFELNLETWESQNPINFGENVAVTVEDNYIPLISQ